MKKLLFTLLSGLIGISSFSQSILANDIAQGEKLIEAYFTPMAESFGAGLNNGWYNTAKPHSLGGFDLTFTLNTVLIPSSAKTFNIKVPGGLKTPAVPLPMLQAGIGLIKNTAIDIRYMPMLNVGDNINVNLFGVGIKHDLLQWIPGIGDAIPMSLSLQAGYTSLNTELKILEQEVSLKTKATTINLVASKKLLMVTGYVGLGYNSATTTFAADADFDLDGLHFDEKVEVAFESNNNLRTNIGLRLNMTVVTIQADYTFAEYPTATLGLGVSLR